MNMTTDETLARGAITVIQLQQQVLSAQQQVLAYQLRDAEAHLKTILGKDEDDS